MILIKIEFQEIHSIPRNSFKKLSFFFLFQNDQKICQKKAADPAERRQKKNQNQNQKEEND